jgi:hypothetical protein
MTPIYKDGKTIQVKQGKRMYVTVDGKRTMVVWHKSQPGMLARWTQECNGCTEYSEGQLLTGPMGCDECGYTGKCRHIVWVPLPLDAHRQAMAKMAYVWYS